MRQVVYRDPAHERVDEQLDVLPRLEGPDPEHVRRVIEPERAARVASTWASAGDLEVDTVRHDADSLRRDRRVLASSSAADLRDGDHEVGTPAAAAKPCGGTGGPAAGTSRGRAAARRRARSRRAARPTAAAPRPTARARRRARRSRRERAEPRAGEAGATRRREGPREREHDGVEPARPNSRRRASMSLAAMAGDERDQLDRIVVDGKAGSSLASSAV